MVAHILQKLDIMLTQCNAHKYLMQTTENTLYKISNQHNVYEKLAYITERHVLKYKLRHNAIIIYAHIN